METPHWLSETPSEFVNRIFREEKQDRMTDKLPRRLHYASFSLLFFIYRGEDLLVMNRADERRAESRIRLPTDRFNVVQTEDDFFQDGMPTFKVEQEVPISIREQIFKSMLKIFLGSAQFRHPSIQGSELLQEACGAAPPIRRILHVSDLGSKDQNYACDMELSIMLIVEELTVGGGPFYRWTTERVASSSEDTCQQILGIKRSHAKDVFLEFSNLVKLDSLRHPRSIQAGTRSWSWS